MSLGASVAVLGAPAPTTGNGQDTGDGGVASEMPGRLRVALDDPVNARRAADALARLLCGPPGPWRLASFFTGAARARRAGAGT